MIPASSFNYAQDVIYDYPEVMQPYQVKWLANTINHYDRLLYTAPEWLDPVTVEELDAIDTTLKV